MNNHCGHNGLKRSPSKLSDKYGELLNLEEVADLLKYPSVAAVRKAHSRKTLPVPLYKFRTKTGLYAKTKEVEQSINNMLRA